MGVAETSLAQHEEDAAGSYHGLPDRFGRVARSFDSGAGAAHNRLRSRGMGERSAMAQLIPAAMDDVQVSIPEHHLLHHRTDTIVQSSHAR